MIPGWMTWCLLYYLNLSLRNKPHGMAAAVKNRSPLKSRRRGIQQGRKAADRIERKARPQQQQDHLLQSPSVPAPRGDAGGQPGTGMPAAGAKVTGNRYRTLLPGSRPVGLAGVVAMMPGMTKTTVRALGGAIALRISGQGVTVVFQGSNTRYNTMQRRTSCGFGYHESLIHFPR